MVKASATRMTVFKRQIVMCGFCDREMQQHNDPLDNANEYLFCDCINAKGKLWKLERPRVDLQLVE